MEPSNRRGAIRWIAATLGIVAALAIAFALDDRSAATSPPIAQSAINQPVEEEAEIEAVRRQIAAESRGEIHPVQVREPPLPMAAPGQLGPAPVPTPPDGYSFTGAPTNMEQSRMDSPTRVEAQEDDGLDWLFADVSVAAIASRAQRDWTFGWLRLADGANAAAAANAVSRFGIDVLGASGRLLRAKLPADEASLAAAAGLPAVSGLGVVPPQRKSHAAFRAELYAAPLQRVPVLITLMAHDQDGRWRHELLARGAEVGRFDADIRAYAANIDAAAFDAIVEADFVLAVEPMEIFRATHDTAVPAMGADAVRFHADAPGLFTGTGGGAVPIGVMDSGLNTNHLDIASHRQSICGANFVWLDHRTEDADLWVDQNGHGTHVTGTIAGNGFAEAKYAGMAPAVAHIRFAKVLSRFGSGAFDSISRGMDFLALASGCEAQAAAVKPLVVNMSLASTSRTWRGRSSGERKLDAVVWAHRQLYVVAQSNDDIHGFSNFGSAKSSLSVGAIQDNGELAEFSSVGPTFDGRLVPQVVGIGVDVYSAKGDGSRGSYIRSRGTSMSSPAVAGVATLLMDAVADYREHPALVRARLMASAIKPDAWLAGGAFAATNSAGPGALQAQFGLGKASARTSVLQRTEADGWESGAATATLEQDGVGHRDIEVPEGASRLEVVLAWDEPPADTIGSAVLNDLDLWLDRDGDCEKYACGEYASTSRRDNVEWIIVENPAPGTYRAGVVAHRVYTEAPRAGLAWTVVRGPSTPTLDLALDNMRAIEERRYRIALSLSVDGYVAAGVRVGVAACRTAADAECSTDIEVRPVVSESGVAHSPSTGSEYVLVGEVGAGERQQVVFDVDIDGDEASRLYFSADAWNANSATTSVVLPAIDDMEAEPPMEAARPANDDFADATEIDGASGSIEVDLLAATFEPGEPPAYFSFHGGERPLASVWFRWTAPASGAMRFGVSAPGGEVVDLLQRERAGLVDRRVQGQRIAALTQLAYGQWGLSFFAEAGETYYIRVSRRDTHSSHPARMTLAWFQGPRPANDDFAAAFTLHAELDASTEPEPPPGSACSVGLVLSPGDYCTVGENRFRVTSTGSGCYEGPGLSICAGGNRLAWGSFEASRVSGTNDWRIEAVPPTEELQGEAGEVSGDNRGATLEQAEQFGRLAATVWYRWTAPEDGAWQFRTDQGHSNLRVLVFAGSSIASLRLLSGYPQNTATLLAKAGAEYRIAVAARNALSPGRTFNLEWEKHERGADADDFAHATELTGASGSEHVIVGDSVEPEEPAHTGVRTSWRQWTAPSSGRFTWRLVDTLYTEIKVAVFTSAGVDEEAADGEDGAEASLAALGLVAGTGPQVTSTEFSFEAVGDRRYWISVGFHNGDFAAFTDTGSATLEWGETPANDTPARAIALAGSSGSIDATGNFATLAPDEPSGVLGHSSVWWSFTPEDAGWYRFWVEDAETATLAVYRVSGKGFDGLERVARSHGDWQAPSEEDSVSARFDAVEGQRYLVRVGQRGDGTDAEWTLNWEQADAPTWLRYAGRLRPSALGLTPDEAPDSAALAFEDGGEVLYLGTTEGLHVLARDADSGALAQTRIVEMDEPQALLWDATRSKLYAFAGCIWRQFAPGEDSRSTLQDEGALTIVEGETPPCEVRAAFLDATGAFLHHGHAYGLDVHALAESGLRAVQSLSITDFQRAVAGAGALVYAIDGHALEVYERDEETGALASIHSYSIADGAVALAVGDGYVVTLSEEGVTNAYTDGSPPEEIDTLAAFGNATWWDEDGECSFIATRPGAAGFDAFCRNSAFSATLSQAASQAEETTSLAATDYVANWQADRFNNYIPPFESQALATSPDGRHAYVYSEGEILIFERIGERPAP